MTVFSKSPFRLGLESSGNDWIGTFSDATRGDALRGEDLFAPLLEYRIVRKGAEPYFAVNTDHIAVHAIHPVNIQPSRTETIALPIELHTPPEGYKFEFACTHHQMGVNEYKPYGFDQ